MRSNSLPIPHQLQRDPVPFSSARVTSHLPEAESSFSFPQNLSTDFEAGTPFLTSFRTDIVGRSGLGFTSVAEMRVSSQTFGPEVTVTVRGAVFKLFRFHLHDWLAIIGLAVLDGILNIIHPFYRYVGLSMIGDYMFPLKDNTVPFQAVPVIALVIPLVFFVGFFVFKKDIVDLHHAILGLFFSVLITAVITDAIKDAVGRPRPDFFWRCFPDGKAVYKNITQEVLCHGDPLVIREGHKSFPSGHTSWSFAGLSFLSLYLAGKIQIFDRRGHVAKLTIVFLPILGALLVGLSRVDDYWHHWQDVFAGALLGSTMALLCYHQFFPALYDINCMGPHSHAHLDLLGPGRYINRRSATGDWPPSGNGPQRDTEGNREDEIPL